jgi:cytochrome oxidase assembly protein ShyY1
MLFKGKYLLGHFLVAIVVLSCFALSAWQFSRLSERKELNSQIQASMDEDTVKLGDILIPGDTKEVVDEFEYRRVSVTGIYREEGEVLILGRSRNGEPGYLVATPLEVVNLNADFQSKELDVVYINRGWIPQSLGDGIRDGTIDRTEIEPRLGYDQRRTVSGIVRANEEKVILGDSNQVTDEVSSRLDSMLFLEKTNVDSEHMYPLWIHQFSETINGRAYPVEGQVDRSYPRILDPPELSERNHLSYAMQWAAFGIVALITWIVICRQALIKQRKREQRATK